MYVYNKHVGLSSDNGNYRIYNKKLFSIDWETDDVMTNKKWGLGYRYILVSLPEAIC